MEIKTVLDFDAAHRLMLHKGLCRNLHGHRWRVEVSYGGEVTDETGMVMDFTIFKDKVKQVLNAYDHACILNNKDVKLINFLKEEKFRLVLVDGEPTSENLCNRIYWELRKVGLDAITKITIYETERNCCERTR